MTQQSNIEYICTKYPFSVLKGPVWFFPVSKFAVKKIT